MEFFADGCTGDGTAYIEIEPGVKYLLHSEYARKHAPIPWWARPPAPPQKALPVDKMRFLPSRRLQDAMWTSEPFTQTVADDLDSFSHVLLHTLLWRDKKRRDGSSSGMSGYLGCLGQEHPKKLLDNRDGVENSLWIMGQDVKKLRAQGKEPDGATLKAVAEELYAVFKVNIGHHGTERSLTWQEKQKEEVKERWKKQYEEYMTAFGVYKDAVEKAMARKDEELRLKAEKKAKKKAEQVRAAEESKEEAAAETDKEKGQATASTKETSPATALVERQAEDVEMADAEKKEGESKGESSLVRPHPEDDGEKADTEEPAQKRPRVE
ncbi:hypothetical protein C8Q78DRAFT_107392 [Trametes maxima]|nr:hypothetical protein C8Q78DRAFT_107392 [Trametes maxima]